MHTTQLILNEMIKRSINALIPHFKREGASDTIIFNMIEGLRVFLNFRACDEAKIYTLKIDRWPGSPELQKVFDKARYGSADFGDGFWLEIKLDFLEEKVSVKEGPNENPRILYQNKKMISI